MNDICPKCHRERATGDIGLVCKLCEADYSSEKRCVVCNAKLVQSAVGVRKNNRIFGPASRVWREHINALECPKCKILYSEEGK